MAVPHALEQTLPRPLVTTSTAQLIASGLIGLHGNVQRHVHLVSRSATVPSWRQHRILGLFATGLITKPRPAQIYRLALSIVSGLTGRSGQNALLHVAPAFGSASEIRLHTLAMVDIAAMAQKMTKKHVQEIHARQIASLETGVLGQVVQ